MIAGVGDPATVGWVDYDTHARTCPRDDLWGQVRRTVGGRALPGVQIDLIVDAIVAQLDLGPADTLLDLACGNGALTSRLHPYCGASFGVDISEYLIGVAQERFASERHGFEVQDAVEAVEGHPEPRRFTKALCYGSLSYLDNPAVARLLGGLHARFPRVERMLLGNLPDPARAGAFFTGAARPDLRAARSDLGVWRSVAEIAELSWPWWRVTVSTMPPRFFAAHYRFDALLVRAS